MFVFGDSSCCSRCLCVKLSENFCCQWISWTWSVLELLNGPCIHLSFDSHTFQKAFSFSKVIVVVPFPLFLVALLFLVLKCLVREKFCCEELQKDAQFYNFKLYLCYLLGNAMHWWFDCWRFKESWSSC